jgi:hypothetical protein
MHDETNGTPIPSRGRPFSTFGAFDISQHLEVLRSTLPELNKLTTQKLWEKMEPYLGRIPDATTFSSTIRGRRSISERFLTALHCAFLHDERYLNEPALRELTPNIWIRPKSGEAGKLDEAGRQAYELVPLEEFRMILAAARASDAYTYLRPHAVTRPWINFGNLQLQGYIGGEDEPEAPRMPTVRLGDKMTFLIDMPFDGHLTVLSYDPSPDGKASSQTYCLNAHFGLDKSAIVAGRHEMPKNGRNVKASGEPSKSAVIGLATRSRVELQWASDLRDPVPIGDLRQFLVEIVSRPEDDRSISVLDFNIEAPHS